MLLFLNKFFKIVFKILGVYLMYLFELWLWFFNRDLKCFRKFWYVGIIICVIVVKVLFFKFFFVMSYFDWIWIVLLNVVLNVFNFCCIRLCELFLFDEDFFSLLLLRCWSICCYVFCWYFNVFVDICMVLKNWNDMIYCV